MSYILEALKKAERERGLAQVPRVTTVHDLATTQKNNTVLVAGGLVVFAVAVLWFVVSIANMITRPPSPAPADVGQGGAVAVDDMGTLGHSTAENSSPLHSRENPSYPDDDVRGSAAVNVSPESSARSRLYLPPPREPGVNLSPEQELTAGGSEQEAITPALAEIPLRQAQAAPGGAAARENAAPADSTQAKPQSLKEALSSVQVSLLMYADAEEDRIVYINGRRYSKGDYVDDRYLIEDITPKGVVLSYKGERAVLLPH